MSKTTSWRNKQTIGGVRTKGISKYDLKISCKCFVESNSIEIINTKINIVIVFFNILKAREYSHKKTLHAQKSIKKLYKEQK